MSEPINWEREYRWARLEATGMVTCPQCGNPYSITKQLKTPYRTSPLLNKSDNGEELIDAPYCPCRKLSEEKRALLKADTLFTSALKECGMSFVALPEDAREHDGVIGYVIVQNILTSEQINAVEQAWEQALQKAEGQRGE